MVLKDTAKSFFHPVNSGEARNDMDSVFRKAPEPRTLQAPRREAPGVWVASFHAKVLEVGDHGRDWAFDQSPSFGRRQ